MQTEGKKFLEQNKSETRSEDYRQRSAIQGAKEGTGTPPKETDTVKVNYRGTLIDGNGIRQLLQARRSRQPSRLIG